jgi:hypothetical protein
MSSNLSLFRKLHSHWDAFRKESFQSPNWWMEAGGNFHPCFPVYLLPHYSLGLREKLGRCSWLTHVPFLFVLLTISLFFFPFSLSSFYILLGQKGNLCAIGEPKDNESSSWEADMPTGGLENVLPLSKTWPLGLTPFCKIFWMSDDEYCLSFLS